MSEILNEFIWAEEFRPKTIEDCILPDRIKNDLKNAIASGNIPNILAAGAPGCGKTSALKAIANEVGAELLYINASLERSVDVIRNRVTTFSSSVSLHGNSKIVLLDEFEGITQIASEGLKAVIEQFPQVRFFFTTNNSSRIIEAIKSRCVNIDFRFTKEDRVKMSAQFFKRVTGILEQKNVQYSKRVVAEVVNQYFPDFRRTLNELQRHAASGVISDEILAGTSRQSFDDLIGFVKEKNFPEVRKWVAQNSGLDVNSLAREFYDRSSEEMIPSSVPQIILILTDYMVKANNTVDMEILLTAMLVEIMVSVEWK